MIIKDLINSIDINVVLKIIAVFYDEKDLEKYSKFYEYLKSLASNKNEEGTTIIINVYLIDEENEIPVSEFDEFDSKYYFDVSAINIISADSMDCLYSISSSEPADFLGFFIDKTTLCKMSKESIIAHCLYEITTYSWPEM